jgi:hypothetical protein
VRNIVSATAADAGWSKNSASAPPLTLTLSLSSLPSRSLSPLLMASVLSFLRTKLKESRDDGEMLTETARRETYRRVPRARQMVPATRRNWALTQHGKRGWAEQVERRSCHPKSLDLWSSVSPYHAQPGGTHNLRRSLTAVFIRARNKPRFFCLCDLA